MGTLAKKGYIPSVTQLKENHIVWLPQYSFFWDFEILESEVWGFVTSNFKFSQKWTLLVAIIECLMKTLNIHENIISRIRPIGNSWALKFHKSMGGGHQELPPSFLIFQIRPLLRKLRPFRVRVPEEEKETFEMRSTILPYLCNNIANFKKSLHAVVDFSRTSI